MSLLSWTCRIPGKGCTAGWAVCRPSSPLCRHVLKNALAVNSLPGDDVLVAWAARCRTEPPPMLQTRLMLASKTSCCMAFWRAPTSQSTAPAPSSQHVCMQAAAAADAGSSRRPCPALACTCQWASVIQSWGTTLMLCSLAGWLSTLASETSTLDGGQCSGQHVSLPPTSLMRSEITKACAHAAAASQVYPGLCFLSFQTQLLSATGCLACPCMRWFALVHAGRQPCHCCAIHTRLACQDPAASEQHALH